MSKLTRWILALLAIFGLKDAVVQAQQPPSTSGHHSKIPSPDLFQSGTKTDGSNTP